MCYNEPEACSSHAKGIGLWLTYKKEPVETWLDCVSKFTVFYPIAVYTLFQECGSFT